MNQHHISHNHVAKLPPVPHRYELAYHLACPGNFVEAIGDSFARFGDPGRVVLGLVENNASTVASQFFNGQPMYNPDKGVAVAERFELSDSQGTLLGFEARSLSRDSAERPVIWKNRKRIRLQMLDGFTHAETSQMTDTGVIYGSCLNLNSDVEAKPCYWDPHVNLLPTLKKYPFGHVFGQFSDLMVGNVWNSKLEYQPVVWHSGTIYPLPSPVGKNSENSLPRYGKIECVTESGLVGGVVDAGLSSMLCVWRLLVDNPLPDARIIINAPIDNFVESIQIVNSSDISMFVNTLTVLDEVPVPFVLRAAKVEQLRDATPVDLNDLVGPVFKNERIGDVRDAIDAGFVLVSSVSGKQSAVLKTNF